MSDKTEIPSKPTYSNVVGEKVNVKFTYYLDLRDSFNPYEIPNLPTVIGAMREAFPLDSGLMVFPLPRENRGLYQVVVNKEVQDLSKLPIQFLRRKENSVEEENISLYLQPPNDARVKKRQQDGVLVTIAQSAMGVAANIPNDAFNKALEKIGELIIPTKLQFYKDTTILNGNRYAVLIPKGEIPVSVTVQNPMTKKDSIFYTRYRGQPYLCRACGIMHKEPCDYLKKFYRLKEQREQNKPTKMILSDSTLRRAQQVGLSADVECMSGGTIGQVAGALIHNPKIKDVKNVVVVAGMNDLKNNEKMDPETFITKVDLGIKKLKTAMDGLNEKEFLIVKTLPSIGASDCDDLRIAHISNEMKNLPSENVKVLNIPGEQIQMGPDTHPTEEGTAFLLDKIDEILEDLIVDRDLITTKRIYTGVDTVYRYGCNACFKKEGRFVATGGYCSDCLTIADNYQPRTKWNALKDQLEQFFPTPKEVYDRELEALSDSVMDDLELSSVSSDSSQEAIDLKRPTVKSPDNGKMTSSKKMKPDIPDGRAFKAKNN